MDNPREHPVDFRTDPPLDIGEFRCTAIGRSGVVVVFGQTNRRYTYTWRGDELGLSEPSIVGRAGPHPPEIVDCLARAVAFKTAREAFGTQPPPPARHSPAALLRGLLHLRG